MCIFRNSFSSLYHVKNYIFATWFSSILKYEPSDFPGLVPPLVPHSHPSYHILGHLSWSSLQKSLPIIFNPTHFDMLHSPYNINTHSFSWNWMSMGKSVSPLKTNHTVNFPVGYILQCCCLCTPIYSVKGDSFNLSVLCHLLHVTPIMRAASYWKIKRLHNTEVSGKEPCLLSMFETNKNFDNTVSCYWTDITWQTQLL